MYTRRSSKHTVLETSWIAHILCNILEDTIDPAVGLPVTENQSRGNHSHDFVLVIESFTHKVSSNTERLI